MSESGQVFLQRPEPHGLAAFVNPVRVLEALRAAGELAVEIEHAPIGGDAIDGEGVPLPDGTLALAREADAVLLGAVGGPKSLHAEGVTLMVATHDINLASERFDQVLLLNRKIIAYGPGPTILTAENLVAAYGGHTHVIAEEDESILLTDSCCDQGEMVVSDQWTVGSGQ